MKKLIFTFLVLGMVGSLMAQTTIEVTPTQKSLITKHTATWCPYCGLPENWDLQDYFAANLDGKDAIVLSAHQSTTSKLYSKAGKDLLAMFQGVVYQPEYFFNQTKLTGSEDAIKAEMITRVNQAAAQPAAVQTGLKAIYVTSTDSLTVATSTQFFQSLQGEYRLAILLVEKEVMEMQASRTGLQKHKRVVRATLTPDVMGVVLVNGNVTANTTFDRNFTVKWNNQYNLNNMEFVTLIWKRNPATNKLEFVNANEVTQVQQMTTATQQPDFLDYRFVVSPNPVRGQAQIHLDLPQPYATAEISLVDIRGAVVKTIYRGNWNSGKQTIDFERNTLSSGLYFVRLQADKQVAMRKVLFP